MKVAILVSYFVPVCVGGGLPDYFPYWMKSASKNTGIDFYIPTNADIKHYEKYNNIKFLCMSVEEFWKKVQEIFDFPITKGFYKIAEYRPFWGIVFKELLEKYDYWGYADCDLIFGDILKFIKPYLNNGEKVIGKYGHFRLIKNTEELCSIPFRSLQGFRYPLTVEKVFTSDFCWYFDEIAGFEVRCHQAGIKVISLGNVLADVTSKYKFFSVGDKNGSWGFVWDNGKLVGYNDLNEEKEFMYVHYQKRRMQVSEEKPGDKFIIIPDKIINKCEKHVKLSRRTFFYTIFIRIKIYKKLFFENKKIGDEGKLIKNELNNYLVQEGLCPTASSDNFLVKILKKARKRILGI